MNNSLSGDDEDRDFDNDPIDNNFYDDDNSIEDENTTGLGGNKYPGIRIFEKSWMSGGISVPPLGVFVEKPAYPGLKEHEYGHYLQYKQMGVIKFYINVAFPSLVNATENRLEIWLFGQPTFSVPHLYYRVETDANSRAQNFFWPKFFN